MKNKHLIISILSGIILVVISFQIGIVFAVQTIPNPGHSWSQMETGPDSIQVSGRTITNLAAPSATTDAATKAYVDGLTGSIPSGVIMLWSGSIASIPTGWVLCNGSNGTPDLRNRFIVGAGSTYAVAATGGEAAHTLTIDEVPSHTHSYRFGTGSAGDPVGVGGGYITNSSTGSTGGGQSHNNLPPYYALAYIMKI